MVDVQTASRAGTRADQAAPRHIVDVLIEERAPSLSRSWMWPLLRPALYQVLNYPKARRMADAIGTMGGRDALDHISHLLQLKVETRGLERLPRNGPLIILANHPTGITDGIALYDALRPIRPEVMFYANADAHRVCQRFGDVLIPVEWVLAKRTRDRTRTTLKMTGEAFAAGKPLMIFPAGRLARVRADKKLTDPEWQSSAISLARKYQLPILPIHVAGPYAFLFHFFDKFSRELRDITLFHELLNKKGRTYTLTVGPLIPHEQILGEPNSTARRVKHYVERQLSEDPDAVFDPNGPECQWRDEAGKSFVQGDDAAV